MYQKKIGVIIFQELLELYPTEFIGLATPTKPMPNSVKVKWKPSSPSYGTPVLRLDHACYRKIAGIKLSLYCFPEAMVLSSNIDEMDFPVEIAGAIVLVDAPSFSKVYLDTGIQPSSFRKTRLVHSQIMPIVIGVIYAKGFSSSDRDAFEKALDIPEIKVMWHDEGLNDEFQYDILSKLCSEIST